MVVDGDAWVPRAIAAGVPAEEIEVVPCTTARGGLNACCAIEPDCIVADLHLADLDGLWLAGALRDQPPAIASTPFILVSNDDDEQTHVRALRGGVDVFVTKPFNVVELVAQIRALIAMAARMRNRRDSFFPVGPASTSGQERAIVGHLGRMSVATVLSALELARRSGELVLSGGAPGRRRLVLELASGALIGGRLVATQLRPLDALREALRWEGKRFQFTPGPTVPAPPNADSIGALVMASIRLDESPVGASGPPPAAAPRPPLPQRTTSGTRHKMPPALPKRGDKPQPLAPPPVPRPHVVAPGHRLVESLVPSARPDPRAEEDSATLKMGTRVRR